MTLIVNLFAGPGAGKSSLMHETIALCKWNKILVEGAFEYVKDMVWEGRNSLLENQVYLFAKQDERVRRLWGKVDVIITDGPTLLSLAYCQNQDFNALEHLAIDRFYFYQPHLNYSVQRVKDYVPHGRHQTESEARDLDDKVTGILKNYNVEYTEIVGQQGSGQLILEDIKKALRAENDDKA